MSDKTPSLSRILKKEAAVFLGFLFLGVVVLPIVIWFIGNVVFGAYGGAGYTDFFGTLSGKIRAGDMVAWFLVLSPWLAVQSVRLTIVAWRAAGKL